MIEKELLQKLRELFSQGSNLTNWITANKIPISEELVAVIYDLQAGTYTSFAQSNPLQIKSFVAEIAYAICTLPEYWDISTILDCGTGEGTTLIPLLEELGFEGQVLGFDVSPSRASWGARNAQDRASVDFFVAEMSRIPLDDNSIDLVLTVHSLEPNGGREKQLIAELARISAKYVVMVEPDFENASPEQKIRMDQLGYIRNLEMAASLVNLELLHKTAIKGNSNPLNKASMWIYKKADNRMQAGNREGQVPTGGQYWVDPMYLGSLKLENGWLKSDYGTWYPIFQGLPLLRLNDATLYLSPPPAS